MPLDKLIVSPITGIQPFTELPLDADIWSEAHNQHHLHRRVHSLAMHRPGIVYGLEVVASTRDPRTVIVAPGVAVDNEGQTILLSKPWIEQLTLNRQIYIVLTYEAVEDPGSAVKVGGGQQCYRVVEGRAVFPTQELPLGKPYIELARIYRTGTDRPITNAANPFDPEYNQLNLLHRPTAFPHCYADMTVAEMTYVPEKDPTNWKPNRAGLWNLLREGNGRGFHIDFGSPYSLSNPQAGADPALLYMAGNQNFQPLEDEELEGLRHFLADGGLLLAEAVGGSTEFSAGFRDLATRLGANLTPVGSKHPLLTAHHIFSAPPPGACEKGELLADLKAGVVFSSFDYGGAWWGNVAHPHAADARDQIRQAQEFGMNLLAFADRNRRLLRLERL
jgi:hypothetical protein